jgi:hypothetical protein
MLGRMISRMNVPRQFNPRKPTGDINRWWHFIHERIDVGKSQRSAREWQKGVLPLLSWNQSGTDTPVSVCPNMVCIQNLQFNSQNGDHPIKIGGYPFSDTFIQNKYKCENMPSLSRASSHTELGRSAGISNKQSHDHVDQIPLYPGIVRGICLELNSQPISSP